MLTRVLDTSISTLLEPVDPLDSVIARLRAETSDLEFRQLQIEDQLITVRGQLNCTRMLQSRLIGGEFGHRLEFEMLIETIFTNLPLHEVVGILEQLGVDRGDFSKYLPVALANSPAARASTPNDHFLQVIGSLLLAAVPELGRDPDRTPHGEAAGGADAS